jgi:hypothetical protein
MGSSSTRKSLPRILEQGLTKEFPNMNDGVALIVLQAFGG